MTNKRKIVLIIFLMIGVVSYAKTNFEEKEISLYVLYSWCFIGCFLQEFIYFFELRRDIAKGIIPVELRSKPYYIITIVGVIVFSSASFLYFYYGDSTQPTFFTTAVFSAGFARLFKSAVSGINSAPVQKLRTETIDKRAFVIRDYFI